ncbi:MAG: FHA domain-containing protein [Tannerellaceae bacterium]|jgi:pSer/pThr/pTyr-binding forkhead associated (FHA) protein|nr:FHA domain-containing protein [Tannerellaceae bacterium]
MEIIIGREGTQPFKITDPYVSKKHAVLRVLPDGTYQLEDTNSTCGTYIVEPDRKVRKIIKSAVTPDTAIRLGEQYEISIRSLLPSLEAQERKEKEAQDIRAKFDRLAEVYDAYHTEKINIQRRAGMKNFYRSLPSLIITLVFGMTMILGENQFVMLLRPVIGIAMIVFIGIMTFQLYKGQKEQPAVMEELNKKFMIDYVCPKCGNFLGFIPFESLRNKKVCSSCKANWL